MPNPAPAPIFALDPAGNALACKTKAIADGNGLSTLRSWLANADVLFVGDKRGEPIVLMGIEVWRRLAQMPFDPR